MAPGSQSINARPQGVYLAQLPESSHRSCLPTAFCCCLPSRWQHKGAQVQMLVSPFPCCLILGSDLQASYLSFPTCKLVIIIAPTYSGNKRSGNV